MCTLGYFSEEVVTSQESPPTPQVLVPRNILSWNLVFILAQVTGHVNNEEGVGGKPRVCVTGGLRL